MKRWTGWLLALAMVLSLAVTAGAPAAAEVVTYYYGDVTMDQEVNASDALAVLKAAVGKLNLNEIEKKAAEVNGDNTINAGDALLILKFAVKKITTFPVGLTFTVGEDDPVPDDNWNPPFDTTNVYNGAYSDDATADTSFVMDNTGLAAKTVYTVSGKALGDWDKTRMGVALQGLINRDFGRDADHTSLVYLVSDDSDSAWLTEMLAAPAFKGYTRVAVATWDKYLEVFANQLKYCGMVLWDPEVPATANVAATICGVDGFLPVLGGSALQTELENAGVEVKQSLVDMFTDEIDYLPGTNVETTFSTKNDAYRWAMEKYFDRCSSFYIAYTLDGAATLDGSPFKTSSHCLHNHDYLIARRCFFFDLDPVIGEAACDDPTQTPGLDSETLRMLFQRRYDRANGTIGMAMGFPPWWAKYTAEHGGGRLAGGALEPYYSEVVSWYNLAMEADAAQPAAMTNGSVYYKFVPSKAAYKNNQPDNSVKYDRNTYYFTVYMGDYDSSAWMKKYAFTMWLNRGGDKARGKLPLMWGYDPNLSYRIPLVFDYVRTHASANDYFVAGNSGAGYVIPSALLPNTPMSATGMARPASTGNGEDQWVKYCKAFYDRFDISITGFIINNGRFDAPVMKMYNRISPVGSLYYNGNDDQLIIRNGVPYLRCRIGVGKDNPSYLYSWATSGMKGYHFAGYRTVSWTPTEIKANVDAYIEYAAGQGKTMQYVDMYTLFRLIRESGEGVVLND